MKIQHRHELEEFEECCAECNYSFPSDPLGSEYIICLYDPVFEPYLDDLLERNDYSRCLDLVERKCLALDQPACEDFIPVEVSEELELSPELSDTVKKLVEEKRLTAETFKQAVLEDAISRIDLATVPVDQHVERLRSAQTREDHDSCLQTLGAMVCQGNKAAFEALCSHLKSLPSPGTTAEVHARILVLREMSYTQKFKRELAQLLAEDLLRTPSNNTTRGWYTAVFSVFEKLPEDVAKDIIPTLLDSSRFSYRIKRRLKGILDRSSG